MAEKMADFNRQKLCDVPKWIRKSFLYGLLMENGSEDPEKEEMFLKRSLTPQIPQNISSHDDFFLILEAIRYWGVFDIPTQVFEYIYLNHKDLDFRKGFNNDFLYSHLYVHKSRSFYYLIFIDILSHEEEEV